MFEFAHGTKNYEGQESHRPAPPTWISREGGGLGGEQALPTRPRNRRHVPKGGRRKAPVRGSSAGARMFPECFRERGRNRARTEAVLGFYGITRFATKPLILFGFLMAGPTRLELATSGVTVRHSNQTELRPRMEGGLFVWVAGVSARLSQPILSCYCTRPLHGLSRVGVRRQRFCHALGNQLPRPADASGGR